MLKQTGYYPYLKSKYWYCKDPSAFNFVLLFHDEIKINVEIFAEFKLVMYIVSYFVLYCTDKYIL